ncbi:MAG: phosphoribosyl-ATP pyrophosphohydrolase [Candidatus Saccharimonadales bacterium]
MKKYNKLVRDKIPQIIKSSGKSPITNRIDNDSDYLHALLDKDREESAELADNPSLEELADKLEVLYAIAIHLGYSPQDIETERAKKAEERGGFEGSIFLESTK